MFALLMKIRLLSGWNVTRDTARRHPLLVAGLSLLGITLFVGMVFGFLIFFDFAARLRVLEETIYQIFYFLFLFLLAGAVPFVASTLLHSSDYGLLFAAPVRPRAVIAAKLIDATVTNALQFVVLGIPAIVACAAASGIPLWGWLLLPLFTGLFVLLPALLTAMGLMVALAVVGMRRLRSAIGLVNLAMAIVVCLTIVQEAKHLPMRSSTLSQALTTLNPQAAMHRSPAAHFAPSQWFASLLQAMAQGDNGRWLSSLLLILAVVGGLYLACIAIGERLLSAASVAEDSEGGTIRSAPESGSTLWRRLFTPPVAALLYKDSRYLWRDSVLLSQLTMPLILFLVPFLLVFNDTTRDLRDELHLATTSMICVIMFMQTSILSLSALGLESRSFWIVRGAPHPGMLLLWSKFLLSLLVSGGCGVLLTFFSGVVLRVSLPILAIQMSIVLLSAASLCGLGVGISATFPRFVYENPAHRVSAWALILGFFASIGYILATGVLYGLAYWTSLQAGMEKDLPLAFGIAGLLHLGLTLFSIVFPLVVGAKRIESYQWEH